MADELTSYLYDHFKMTLTPSQKDAVEALHGPICVISFGPNLFKSLCERHE